MKRSIIILLLFSSHLFAQKTNVFRIDSIPQKGILLDKNWKWHTGDNPDFAKADFDDSSWKAIDPTNDIMSLPQISKNGDISWLRLTLVVDSILKDQLVMMIQQSGASEIYLNGKKIHSFGVLSKTPENIKAWSYFYPRPVAFPVEKGSV